MPSERIQLLIDVVTGNSKSTLGKLKSDLAGADTATQKFGVAAKSAGTFLKQNLALGAAAAGTAIAGFAAKSVSDFQKIALGAGELRDSLGVTAEEASRLQEVASDLGIPVDALESSIGRMNRAAADTPEAFDAIGASIARNRDGTTDVNQTFLNTIDALNRIPDATARAAAAQKIFGRGWMQIAELVGQGADDVKARLDAVGDAKVVDDAQIAQAREFRDNLDEVNDSVSSVAEKIGSGLVPVLNDLIGIAQSVSKAIAAIPFKEQAAELAKWTTFGLLFQGIGKANEVLEDLTGTTHGAVGAMASYRGELSDTELQVSQFQAAQARASEATKDQYESATEAANRAEQLAEAQSDAAAAADEHRAALQRLADNTFTAEGAMLAAEDAVADFRSQLRETRDVLADSSATARDKAAALNDLRQAEIGAAEEAIEAAKAIADESDAVEGSVGHTAAFRDALSALAARFPALRDEINAYIARLNAIPRSVTTNVNTIVNPTIGGPIPRKASGGLVGGSGEMALVGEAGPELVALPAHSRVFPHGQSVSMLRGMGVPGFAAGGVVLPRSRAATRAAQLGAQADKLRDEARALTELAKATEDAEEKKKLLEQRDELLDRAENKLRRSTALAEQAQRSHADVLEGRADRLRDLADAHREAADAARESAQAEADALTEQANSLRESVDARLSLADATDAAREAAEAATEAHRTFGLSTEERGRIDREAQRAALALADAQVQAAREAAEASGRSLTAAQQTAIFQRSLQNQVTGASNDLRPVLQALVGSLRLGDEIARERRAEQVVAQGERAAEKQLVSADKNLAAADKLSAAAETLNARNMERILRSLLKAQGVMTRKEIERALRGIAA